MKATKNNGYLIQIEKSNEILYLSVDLSGYGFTPNVSDAHKFNNMNKIDKFIKSFNFDCFVNNLKFKIIKDTSTINHV